MKNKLDCKEQIIQLAIHRQLIVTTSACSSHRLIEGFSHIHKVCPGPVSSVCTWCISHHPSPPPVSRDSWQHRSECHDYLHSVQLLLSCCNSPVNIEQVSEENTTRPLSRSIVIMIIRAVFSGRDGVCEEWQWVFLLCEIVASWTFVKLLENLLQSNIDLQKYLIMRWHGDINLRSVRTLVTTKDIQSFAGSLIRRRVVQWFFETKCLLISSFLSSYIKCSVK